MSEASNPGPPIRVFLVASSHLAEEALATLLRSRPGFALAKFDDGVHASKSMVAAAAGNPRLRPSGYSLITIRYKHSCRVSPWRSVSA